MYDGIEPDMRASPMTAAGPNAWADRICQDVEECAVWHGEAT
jgi:hypothetical protein